MTEQDFEGLWFPETRGFPSGAVAAGSEPAFPLDSSDLFRDRETLLLSRADGLLSPQDADETRSLGFDGHPGEGLRSLHPPITGVTSVTGQRRPRSMDRPQQQLQQAFEGESSSPRKRHCGKTSSELQRGSRGTGRTPLTTLSPSLTPSLVCVDERSPDLMIQPEQTLHTSTESQEATSNSISRCESKEGMEIQATIIARPAKGSTPGRLEVIFHQPERPNLNSRFQAPPPSGSWNSPSPCDSPVSRRAVPPTGSSPRPLPVFKQHQNLLEKIEGQTVLSPCSMAVIPASHHYPHRQEQQQWQQRRPQHQQQLQSDRSLPNPQNSFTLTSLRAQPQPCQSVVPSALCGSHSHRPRFAVHPGLWNLAIMQFQCPRYHHHHHHHQQLMQNTVHPSSQPCAASAASVPDPLSPSSPFSTPGVFPSLHPCVSSQQHHWYAPVATAVSSPVFGSVPTCSCYSSSSPESHHLHSSPFQY